MFLVRLVGLTAIALLLLACGGAVSVQVSYDPAAQFSRYRTFAMAEPNKTVRTEPGADPFVHRRLRQLTFESLRSRGLVAAKKSEADLVVFVMTGSRQRVDVYRDYYGSGFYGPYGYGGPGYMSAASHTVVVDETLVVIDLVDRAENSVLWRGTGYLDRGSALSDSDLRDAVTAILSRYPPSGSEK